MYAQSDEAEPLQARKKIDATLGRAGAIVIDEWSQLPSALFHASSLRATSVLVSLMILMIEVPEWMNATVVTPTH